MGRGRSWRGRSWTPTPRWPGGWAPTSALAGGGRCRSWTPTSRGPAVGSRRGPCDGRRPSPAPRRAAWRWALVCLPHQRGPAGRKTPEPRPCRIQDLAEFLDTHPAITGCGGHPGTRSDPGHPTGGSGAWRPWPHGHMRPEFPASSRPPTFRRLARPPGGLGNALDLAERQRPPSTPPGNRRHPMRPAARTAHASSAPRSECPKSGRGRRPCMSQGQITPMQVTPTDAHTRGCLRGGQGHRPITERGVRDGASRGTCRLEPLSPHRGIRAISHRRRGPVPWPAWAIRPGPKSP
jgi:hypothetical protein